MTESFSMLVTAEWLQQSLGAVKVLDCTTHMVPQPVGPSKISSGRPDFDRAHIPGASHVDMVEDLSDPDGQFPYTLPGGAQIERLLSGLGIANSDHIVLYTTTQLMVATRAWYVLRALGHERVSILNGGLAAWTDAGYPVESSVAGGIASALGVVAAGTGANAADAATSVTPSVGSVSVATAAPYVAAPDPARYASKQDVANAAPDTVVVNALSAEQHAGTGGAHYGRPGRIPGSVSVPTASLLVDDGRSFAPVETIREQFAARGITPQTPVITYCGGGIAATVDAFALALTGHQDWAVYDNSLLEWSSDPSCPMETD